MRFAVLFVILTATSSVFALDEKSEKFTKQYDLSDLLKPKRKFLGFVEPNYQRLKIEFASVIRTMTEPSLYKVTSTSVVKNVTCRFAGTIQINKVNEDPHPHYGTDNELANAGIKMEGNVEANYELKEEDKKGCGIFRGKMTLNWYIDKDGRIRYDDIGSSESDGFKNNQYQGTWRLNDRTKAKRANWGEFRIPDSGDLDIGAGEFGANPKYMKYGWE